MNVTVPKRVLRAYETFIPPDAHLEDRRRVTLHVTLSLIAIVFLFLFCVLALLQNNVPLAIADLVSATVLIADLFD